MTTIKRNKNITKKIKLIEYMYLSKKVAFQQLGLTWVGLRKEDKSWVAKT